MTEGVTSMEQLDLFTWQVKAPALTWRRDFSSITWIILLPSNLRGDRHSGVTFKHRHGRHVSVYWKN